ncbi:MAG: proton-conducting transporter membrane subunit [Anaerolineae bacterium]
MNVSTSTWLIALPLALSPVIYLWGRLGLRVRRATTMFPWMRWFAVAVLAATWIPLVVVARQVLAGEALAWTAGAVAWRIDGLSVVLSFVALLLGTAVALYSGPYVAGETGEEKYYTLLLMLVGSMIGLACTGDLFNLWVWFELMALSSYFLVAFYRQQPASLEAGVKYLVQSAAGSVLVLMGISLVLAQTGTLELRAIAEVANASPALLLAGGLFVVGFGVKVALVPMHTWLPDAHAQAPSGISAMLSGVVIEAGLVALLRAIAALLPISLSWGVLLMGFGAINMLAGNLMALRQSQLKRMLAFSSVSHVGYMLVGLGVGLYAGEAAAAQGGLFHLINHGIMKGLAFLAAGAFLYALHVARGDHAPLTIDELAGAARRYPWAALTLSIALLGLGGLPPLAGFMSKWQILVGSARVGTGAIYALIVFTALNSVLSLGYYVPVINAMYRRQPSQLVLMGADLPRSMVAVMIVLAVLIVVLGVWPGLVQSLTAEGARAVIAAMGG